MKNYKDPFELLFSELSTAGQSLIDDLPRALGYSKTTGQVNLSSDEKEYKVEVLAPGFTKDELDIELKDKILTIKAEHKTESMDKGKTFSKREFSKSSFSRSFNVPDSVSGEIDAVFENGILNILLKKKELPPKEESKKIVIK